MSSAMKNLVKLTAKRLGYVIRNVRHHPCGLDIWSDVKNLSIAFSKPVQCVFDVGANVGSTSQQLLKEFDSCRVFAFEPHRVTFEKLKNNIKSDRFFPIQLAFSDTSGTQTFYDYGEYGEDASVLNSLTPNTRYARRAELKATELSVSTSTIDKFCIENKIQRIDVLKIDTEGHDFNVLKGAEKMLSTNAVDFVYFEFNDFKLRPGTEGGSLNEITDYLTNFGFRFIATYTDSILTEGELFVVANALLINTK